MRYFRLMVDERVKHRVEPAALSPLQVEDILTGTQGLQDDPLFLAVHTDQRTVYPDFLEYPLPLVSDRMKALLEKYMPGLEWRAVHPYRFSAGQAGGVLGASSAEDGSFVRTNGMVPQ